MTSHQTIDAIRGRLGFLQARRAEAVQVIRELDAKIEELTRLLPEGIGLVVSYNNIRHGTLKEFRSVIGAYGEQVNAFGDAPDKVDAIHPAGTPPFMLLGFKRERALVKQWERETKIPVFTSGMNQVRALKALGIAANLAVLQEHIRKKYQAEMSLNHISTYKTTILRDAGKEGGMDKPKERPTNNSDEVSIRDLQIVKDLAERLGTKKFRSLIDLLVPLPVRKEPKVADGPED